MPLAVAAMILAGCSDYDNGFTEKQIQFHSDFNHEFGSFDKTQDWNLAERANVTVTTSEMKDINVYTEKDGTYVQVGAFKNVMGTRKLEFDVIEQTKKLVVSDGDVALRAVVGGTVNFDDMTSVKGEVLETRTHDVNRNEWETRYVIPANVTPEEEAKVVAEFRKVREGAYNTVKIDWTRMFVQQVHKGEGVYVDGNGASIGLGSDHMNHLQIYNKKGNNVFNTPAMGGFGNSHWEHVNDFNTGKQNASYEEIMGMTFLYNLDPTDCPTVHVRDGVDWVQQFLYHNSTDSKYHAEYIMLEIDGNYYLGFDFYAHGTDIYSANKNMDVERDWRFDDWIIKVSNAENSIIPVKKLETAQPQAWILAGEDLGGGFDIDYNDVVVKVERVAGENKVRVTPLAAGGTLASYLFFGTTCIGEIHQLLDASPARSGSYQPINLSGDLHEPLQSVEVNVAQDWGLTEDMSKANNMGGFTIRVLPAGTEPMAKGLNLDDPAFDKATTVKAPQQGEAPYIICVPYAYKLTNHPEPGLSEATVWEWPGERINIAEVYEEFEAWAHDKTAKKDWYTKPIGTHFVNTGKFTRKSFGVQPAKMTDFEIQETGNPNADLTIYNEVPSVYPEQKQPEATLELKQEGDIYVQNGQTIDILDYINTNYPEKVFCVSTSTGEQEQVSGSFTKLKTLQADHRTLIHIRIATPDGLLNVDVYVNSGTSSADSNKQENNIVLYDNGTAIYNIPTIAAGETKTYTITSNGSGSYSVVGSEFFTASVNGNTLTITGVKAGQANLILTQAADDTYKAATGTYWLTATGAQQATDNDNGDDVNEGGNDTPSGGAVLLTPNSSTNIELTVTKTGDHYNIKYKDGTPIITGASSVVVEWKYNGKETPNLRVQSWGDAFGGGNITVTGDSSVTLDSSDLDICVSHNGVLELQIANANVKFYLKKQ